MKFGVGRPRKVAGMSRIRRHLYFLSLPDPRRSWSLDTVDALTASYYVKTRYISLFSVDNFPRFVNAIFIVQISIISTILITIIVWITLLSLRQEIIFWMIFFSIDVKHLLQI